MKGKVIEGIGMSFSQKNHNVEYFVQKRLYTPPTELYYYAKQETKWFKIMTEVELYLQPIDNSQNSAHEENTRKIGFYSILSSAGV